MFLLLPLIVAIIPVVILLNYFIRQDTNSPEPKGNLIRVFIAGILIAFPIGIVEMLIAHNGELFALILSENTPFSPQTAYNFFRAFLVAGFVEETAKLMIVYKMGYIRKTFDEKMDGIVYAVVTGLGFACIENIMYVLSNGVYVGILRAFSAVPAHALFGVVMGYFIGHAKFSRYFNSVYFTLAYTLAIFLHGLYNFLLMQFGRLPFFEGGWKADLIYPLLIVLFIIARFMVRAHVTHDKKMLREKNREQVQL